MHGLRWHRDRLQDAGVHENTLRRWTKLGLIDSYRVTDTGHRHYDVGGLLQREQARIRAKRKRLERLA